MFPKFFEIEYAGFEKGKTGRMNRCMVECQDTAPIFNYVGFALKTKVHLVGIKLNSPTV